MEAPTLNLVVIHSNVIFRLFFVPLIHVIKLSQFDYIKVVLEYI